MRNATRLVTSCMGALMGLAGIEHGIGEILQGNVAPVGIMIQSWPDSAFYSSLGGEPAMTIIPDLLASGVLTVIVSLAYLVWAVWFVDRKHGGLTLILLSIPMLLVGAGIFPPILGAIVGGFGTRIHAPVVGWQTRLAPGVRRFLANLFPVLFAACLIVWMVLFAGVPLLGYFLGFDDSGLILALVLSAFGLFFAAFLTALVRDPLIGCVQTVKLP